MSKFRYLSGREKLSSFDNLYKGRHLYLKLSEAEPNLGYVGEKPLPIGVSTFYSLVTVENGTSYDRYWKEVGLRVEDEGVQVGVGNQITTMNYVGAAITVISTSSSSVDIKVFSPGNDNQIIYNNNDEFAAASDFYYDSNSDRVGIGTFLPQQKLDINGNLKIYGNIYDSNNVVGLAGSILTSTGGNRVIWSRGAPVLIASIPESGAIPGQLWWNKDTGNLKVYYDDGNSEQWVDASSGMGIQGLQGATGGEIYWKDEVLGISTNRNVGILTENPTSALTVIGDGYFSGIITAIGGFISSPNTTPVTIEVEGSNLIFNISGIGSATLALS